MRRLLTIAAAAASLTACGHPLTAEVLTADAEVEATTTTFAEPAPLPNCNDTQGAEPCHWTHLPEGCVPEGTSVRHCYPLMP